MINKTIPLMVLAVPMIQLLGTQESKWFLRCLKSPKYESI